MTTARMSTAEREGFLADVHVGILTVADAAGRGPLAVPVGYTYVPGGDIVFGTGADSRKMVLLRAAGRCGFIVQTEEMPFKYVSVEGPVVAEEPMAMELYRAINARYLDPEDEEEFAAASAEGLGSMVAVRIRPERWRTYDSGKEAWG